ncbi:MAG: 2-C-methyl-D-erythritol 4-phosphate cytidylyltransferase [Thermodesulfobacteriota bacterium]
MQVTAIIPAGGSGQRMGLAEPKQFVVLAGLPLLIHTLRAFSATPAISAIVVAAPPAEIPRTEALIREYGIAKIHAVVAGGTTRQESVRQGLAAVPAETELVAVHDAARPLVTPALIEACIAAATRHGAAIAAVPVKDTLKRETTGQLVATTVDRTGLWQAQTPQVARRELLEAAYAAAERDNFRTTDEASLLEHHGCPVALVAGSETNLKVTRPEDLTIAEALLMPAPQATALRIGHGYDAHRLVAGRALILGGVTVPHQLGLLGHSDADVLTHALCDALLGALGQGDIGRHFPDSDPQYRGVSSLKLLAHVISLMHKEGFCLANADLTVIAQQPKLAPHLAAMRANLAAVCQASEAVLNLKATTTEGMGFAGREEGIAAHAVVLLSRL